MWAALIGAVAGGLLATLMYALDRRARANEELWSRRLDPYREIWAVTRERRLDPPRPAVASFVLAGRRPYGAGTCRAAVFASWAAAQEASSRRASSVADAGSAV